MSERKPTANTRKEAESSAAKTASSTAVISFSGADLEIIEKLPAADKKPYYQVGLGNMACSIACAFALTQVLNFFYDPGIGLLIGMFVLLLWIFTLVLRQVTRSLINKGGGSQTLLLVSIIVLAMLIGLSYPVYTFSRKTADRFTTRQKTYDSLRVLQKKITVTVNNDPKIYREYVNNYEPFLSFAESHSRTQLPADSPSIYWKVIDLRIRINAFNSHYTDRSRSVSVSLPLSELSNAISAYFAPRSFYSLSFEEKIKAFVSSWSWRTWLDFLALALPMFTLLFSSYFRIFTSRKDFYHRLLAEKKRLSQQELEKQRTKITEEFKIQTEIKNVRSNLAILGESAIENKEEIAKLSEGLKTDYSPLSIRTLAELEFKQAHYKEALDYINKAIDLDADLCATETGRIQNPELYEFKAIILQFLSDTVGTKAALDKFVELTNESRYRQNLDKEIYLDRLEVENLPFYGSFSWQFRPGINILLGKNGFGKSHLLGLAVSLLYNDKEQLRNWIPENASQARARIYVLSDHPQEDGLIASLQKQLELRILEKRDYDKKGKPSSGTGAVDRQIKNITEQIDAEKRRILGDKEGISGKIGKVPILAIPDSRFIDKSETSIGNNKSASEDLRKDGATEFLYTRSFAGIIKKGLFIVAQKNSTDFSREPYSLIERTISHLAGNTPAPAANQPANPNSAQPKFFKFEKIEPLSTTGDYKFWVKSEENDQPFELQKISQGTFSVLAICLMIYRFLSELRPGSTDVMKEKAIIFIDEIDAHLHPSWEQKIIGILRREFPNVQFIITGHSPLIVAGCLEGEVSVMRHSPKGGFVLDQSRESYIGIPASEVFNKIFEIEDRDEQYVKYMLYPDTKIQELEKRKQQLTETKDKGSFSPDEKKDLDKDLEEVLQELNNLDTVKRAAVQKTDTVFMESENNMLKSEVERLQRLVQELRQQSGTVAPAGPAVHP